MFKLEKLFYSCFCKQIRKNTFNGCEKLSLLVFRDGMDDVQVDESVTDGKTKVYLPHVH